METTNDQCPERGPALTHISSISSSGRCIYCAQPVAQVPSGPPTPTVTKVAPAVSGDRKLHLAAEDLDMGLLDAILALRHEPISEAMLADPSRTSDEWLGHLGAVDAVLDLIVPALQQIASLEASRDHGSNCIFRPAVDKQIGRVPKRRVGRWTRD